MKTTSKVTLLGYFVPMVDYTNAHATNQLFLQNLAKGQTGLSIAFDLATQCGYDSDHPLALPEVGKVGVPINSLDDFRILFDPNSPRQNEHINDH